MRREPAGPNSRVATTAPALVAAFCVAEVIAADCSGVNDVSGAPAEAATDIVGAVRTSAIVWKPPAAFVNGVLLVAKVDGANFESAAAESIDDKLPLTVASALDK